MNTIPARMAAVARRMARLYSFTTHVEIDVTVEYSATDAEIQAVKVEGIDIVDALDAETLADLQARAEEERDQAEAMYRAEMEERRAEQRMERDRDDEMNGVEGT